MGQLVGTCWSIEAKVRDGPSRRHPENPPPSVTDRCELSSTVRWKSGERLTKLALTIDVHWSSRRTWRNSWWNRRSTSCQRLSARSKPDSVIISVPSADKLTINRPPWLAGSKVIVSRSPAITCIDSQEQSCSYYVQQLATRWFSSFKPQIIK